MLPLGVFLVSAVALLAGSAINILTPKLPTYELSVASFPCLHWMTKQNGRPLKTVVTTRVELFNENLAPIDIFSIRFDLYSKGWNSGLQHIGIIEDMEQQPFLNCLHKHRNPYSSKCKSARPEKPIWQVKALQHFDILQTLYMDVPSVFALASTFFTLAGQLFSRSSGNLVVPSTGAAHIKVLGVKSTVSMVCENVVDIWHLKVKGMECQLKHVRSGWVSLMDTAARLGDHFVHDLQAFDLTGSLFVSNMTSDGYINNTKAL